MTGETFFQLHYHLTGTERLFDLARASRPGGAG